MYQSRASKVLDDVGLGASVAWINTIVGSIAIFGFTLVLRGLVLATLWNWFISSALGAARLNIGEALGLTCTFGFLTMYFTREKGAGGFLTSLIGSGMALGYACILHYIFGIGA